MDAASLLKKVKKIEIKARGKAQDIFSGAYHSAFKGRGMSFAETRTYQYGDDVRNIDWNVSARSQETQVKVFEEERELTIMLLIDISASNLFGSSISKKERIAEIAAVLAINAMKNNDKVGLILFSDKVELYIPPSKGKKQILRVIREIINAESIDKQTKIKSGIEFLNRVQKKRSVLFLLSDFMDEDYIDTLKLVKKRHDLIPVKLSDVYELDFPDLGNVILKDLETGKTKLVDTSDQKIRKYLASTISMFEEEVKSKFNKNGIRHLSFTAEDDYVKSFIKFFKKR